MKKLDAWGKNLSMQMKAEKYQIITALIALLITLTFTTACTSNQEKARKTVEAYLHDRNITTREMTVDMFHISDQIPDKSYINVTVTYNFASTTGEFQKEHLAFVLKRDGQNWAVDRQANPSKDIKAIEAIIAGGNGKLPPNSN